MADTKSILIGMLLGVILVIALESAVMALLLKNYKISPSNVISSLFGSNIPISMNASSIQSLFNSTLHPASPRVSVSRVAVFGNINVKGANLTNKGDLSGTLYYNTVITGFNAATNTSKNCTIVIPNYSSLQMLVYAISAGTRNFTVATESPQVPSFIEPNGSKNFTLAIRLPNGAYAGALNIDFNATLLKGSE